MIGTMGGMGPSQRLQMAGPTLAFSLLLQAFVATDCFSAYRPPLGLRGSKLGVSRQTAVRPVSSTSNGKWMAQLKFYQAQELQINWKNPQARGNFGTVYFGRLGGEECVVKCPILQEFSLKLFDTERAVNIKLNKASGNLNVPWAQMLGEVNIPESVAMPDNVARIGIVWKKEGDGSTLEDYLQSGKDLAKVLGVKIPKDSMICVDLSLKVMAQMLIALLQIQDAGIMHRDVKPSNTLVVPSNAKHTLKVIDFGSCCDWGDPFKLGLGDATNDPMYAAPEQTLNFIGPGKFDVFSVGMMGVRTLIPSFQRGGQTTQWPGGRFQKFAEQEFPATGYDLKTYLVQKSEDPSEPILAAQCRELLESPDAALVRDLLQDILVKNVIGRPGAADALKRIGVFGEAAAELKEVQDAEAANKREAAKSSKEGAEQERADEQSTKAAESDEKKRQELGAKTALNAAAEFIKMQKKERGSAKVRELFGIPGGGSGRGDDDIDNVVPDDWQEGNDFYRSPKLTFNTGEIVVTFRSDGSRRFGKIIQDYGQGTYDILVDRLGGQGDGQFRTELQKSIGKIATGRSLKEEEAASQEGAVRAAKRLRKAVIAKSKLGDRIPDTWMMNVDVAFGPTSFFKPNETVCVANKNGILCFASVLKVVGDGTLEVRVGTQSKRLYFVGSIGKILI